MGILLFAIFTKNQKRRKKSIITAVVMMFFFTNHFIYNQVALLWEVETITESDIQNPYDIGILLGGYSNPNVRPGQNRHNFSERGNRFMNALELYHAGKFKKILLTGGSGRILAKESSEAVQMQSFLIKIGIPAEDIIVEGNSRNTYENAIFTKAILDEKYPNAKCLLITSAWHMPRSIGCFRKAGVEFTPYSVDFISEKTRYLLDDTLIPDRLGFYRWEILIKEWVGYVAYWVKGYI